MLDDLRNLCLPSLGVGERVVDLPKYCVSLRPGLPLVTSDTVGRHEQLNQCCERAGWSSIKSIDIDEKWK